MVASGSPDFLIKAAQILRDAGMNNRSDIRLVHADSKGGRADNDIILVIFPACQNPFPFLRFCRTRKGGNILKAAFLQFFPARAACPPLGRTAAFVAS